MNGVARERDPTRSEWRPQNAPIHLTDAKHPAAHFQPDDEGVVKESKQREVTGSPEHTRGG